MNHPRIGGKIEYYILRLFLEVSRSDIFGKTFCHRFH